MDLEGRNAHRGNTVILCVENHIYVYNYMFDPLSLYIIYMYAYIYMYARTNLCMFVHVRMQLWAPFVFL